MQTDLIVKFYTMITVFGNYRYLVFPNTSISYGKKTIARL